MRFTLIFAKRILKKHVNLAVYKGNMNRFICIELFDDNLVLCCEAYDE